MSMTLTKCPLGTLCDNIIFDQIRTIIGLNWGLGKKVIKDTF